MHSAGKMDMKRSSFTIVSLIKIQWVYEFKILYLKHFETYLFWLKAVFAVSSSYCVALYVFIWNTEDEFLTMNNVSRINSFQRQPIPTLQTSMTATSETSSEAVNQTQI